MGGTFSFTPIPADDPMVCYGSSANNFPCNSQTCEFFYRVEEMRDVAVSIVLEILYLGRF